MVRNIKNIKVSLKIVEKILKAAGAKRISKKAESAFLKILKEEMLKIADLSVKNARHFGRKLIREEDINYAVSKLKIPFA